jgi:hypothetical protein
MTPPGAVADPASHGAHFLVGVAVLTILGAMGAGWLFRALLLRRLRKRHPDAFALLGSPRSVELASLLPRYREMQVQFWKYLWEGRIFSTGDGLVSALAVAALLADVAFVAGTVLLAWAAWR